MNSFHVKGGGSQISWFGFPILSFVRRVVAGGGCLTSFSGNIPCAGAERGRSRPNAFCRRRCLVRWWWSLGELRPCRVGGQPLGPVPPALSFPSGGGGWRGCGAQHLSAPPGPPSGTASPKKGKWRADCLHPVWNWVIFFAWRTPGPFTDRSNVG